MHIRETYDLPDAEMLTLPAEAEGKQARCMVWTPREVMVVVGKGTHSGQELNEEQLVADNIPVVRRGTGGCAVLLSPEMIVVSFAVYAAEQLTSGDYFRAFNQAIIRAFENLGINGLAHAGISDIALNGRKVAGTAIYRNRELVFYHAILNLGGDTLLMEKYLRYPPRTPDYRNGRSHKDFVTSFHEQQLSVDESAFAQAVQTEFDSLSFISKAPVA